MSKESTSEVVSFDWKKAARDPGHARSFIPKTPCFLSYDPAFKNVIGDSPKLTLIDKRGDKFAHEAGVYTKSTNKNYFTSNYQTGRSIETYAVDCATHEIEEVKYEDVITANGACNYQDKVLYCCQGNLTTPSALVLADPSTSKSEIILDNFHGREFNSINDVVIQHKTGDIFFTDPTYGYEQAFRPPPQLPSQIYRFRPSTGQISCVADGFVQCNGLCFSPDYKRMYVTDTGAVQAHGTPGNGQNFSFNQRLPSSIYEFDVMDDGTRLGNRRFFAYCDSGVPDGIKCDEAGRVYSGCGDGVHVWDAQGTLIGKIFTAAMVANFNFSKGGMWLMAEEMLYFCELGARGALAEVEGH